jgi:predicted nucleic acid-binding protein
VILVDTSVWIEHLRAGDERLTALLDAGEVLAHPFVIGELALGNLRGREAFMRDLRDLPRAAVVDDEEVLRFIERQGLFGRGIGYIDTHLLAAARLTAGARLWTRDESLQAVAAELGLAAMLPHSPVELSRRP